MPKGTAKGRILPVRFTHDDLKAMAAAAKASKQTVSEWIRGTIQAELNP
jgi:predicted HicB family RNase H-like nuclease